MHPQKKSIVKKDNVNSESGTYREQIVKQKMPREAGARALRRRALQSQHAPRSAPRAPQNIAATLPDVADSSPAQN
jgi:hypothetical protein